MSHYTPDDWVKIITALSAFAAAIASMIGAWRGQQTAGLVGAIHHETVIKPRVAAVKAALDVAAQERNS